VVALADKLETLVGLFGIGQVPTGDKDPYALRRHALGVIRILMDQNLELSLPWLLEKATSILPLMPNHANRKELDDFIAQGERAQDVKDKVLGFIFERLDGVMRDREFSAQEVDAVLSLRPPFLGQIPQRLLAVRAFAQLPEAPALAAANKRVANILKKSPPDFEQVPPSWTRGTSGYQQAQYFTPENYTRSELIEDAEKTLERVMNEIAPISNKAFDDALFTESLQALARLKTPIDDFFATVMVNVDNYSLQQARLGLLKHLHLLMNRIADLSKLTT
jgi:glycyl-tRNA synthetase beta chain